MHSWCLNGSRMQAAHRRPKDLFPAESTQLCVIEWGVHTHDLCLSRVHAGIRVCCAGHVHVSPLVVCGNLCVVCLRLCAWSGFVSSGREAAASSVTVIVGLAKALHPIVSKELGAPDPSLLPVHPA